MMIKKLRLQNFRGFKDYEVTFTEKFTVLTGENGVGKSALLEGLAVALGVITNPLYGGELADLIKPLDIRVEKVSFGNACTVEKQFPLVITCLAEIAGENYHWSITRDESGTSMDNVDFLEKLIEVIEKVRAGKYITLPVYAYYGASRNWVTDGLANESGKKASRLKVFQDCLNAAKYEKAAFAAWFKNMLFIKLKEGEEPLELQAVRKAVAICLQNEVPGVYELDYDPRTDEIQVLLPDGRLLPFQLLGDGERLMLGMVADLAYRMAVVNPHLAGKAIEETPGVVLIDELDLHLHPAWQERIISNLKLAFPNVQFIVSTHSPCLLNAEAEELKLHA